MIIDLKNWRKRLIFGLVFGVLSAGLTILVSSWVLPDIFDNFEAKTLDLRYLYRVSMLTDLRKGNPIEDIVVVDIDERSLQKLGNFNQWPRRYHARLIDNLTRSGALAVVFDILFLEADANSDQDHALIESTANSRQVVHALSFSDADPNIFLYPMAQPPDGFWADKFSMLLPDSIVRRLRVGQRFEGKLMALYDSAAAMGFTNFIPDHDSVIRHMPLVMTFAGRQYPSLALAAILHATGIPFAQIDIHLGEEIRLGIDPATHQPIFRIPIDKQGEMLIDYQGTYQTFRNVSYYDVLEDRLQEGFFQDKIVLIGASAAGLSDLRPVPFQSRLFPGVEVHANIVYDILAGSYLHSMSPGTVLLSIFISALFVSLLGIFFRPTLSIFTVIVVFGIFIYFAIALFTKNQLLVEMVRPATAGLLGYMAALIYRYVDEEREKRLIKGIFNHYTSPKIVDELLQNPDKLKLGGEKRLATAFFSDIKNFTTVSEALTPDALVLVLNEYLSAMTEVVLRYEGYLDKYEGDAIMAIFGVPVAQSDHAKRACYAALEQQKILVEMRKKWQRENKPQFEVRVGINSGEMIAGNIGGEKRFDYTVIGDSVNLASRLEGANKGYGTRIMISEFTYEFIKDELITRELDFIRVKGKTKPVRIYEVVCRRDEGLDVNVAAAYNFYVEALNLYRAQKWSEAIAVFQKVLRYIPNDPPTEVFLQRCKHFIENPFTEPWDGVFEMKTK